MGKTNNICVFDVKNVQEEYAYALEFIECCENGNEKENATKSRLGFIADKISIKGGVVDKGTPVRYYESPIERRDKNSTDNFILEMGIKKLKVLKPETIQNNDIYYFTNNEMLYHIRIHLKNDDSDFVNMQYLALMLQKLEGLFVEKSDVKKRLSVFIVPCAGVECPYFSTKNDEYSIQDNEIYKKASQFLRLLSKEYAGIIYSIKELAHKRRVLPIDYTITSKTINFFPMLIVDRFNYYDLFENVVDLETLKELFNLEGNRRFRNAASENPKEALCDFVAETSFRCLQEKLSENELNVVKDILVKEKVVDWITFSFFSFTFKADKQHDIRQEINYLWDNAVSLCKGIKQLVQNSIQHSQKRTCVFCFVLNKNSGEFLEIKIGDINYKQSIVSNFVQNLEWEWENIDDPSILNGHGKLIGNKDNIKLCNFFSEFKNEDDSNIWKEFRRQDISAHVGLLLFYIVARRFNARMSVRSSTYYQDNNEKSYFFKNFSDEDCDINEHVARAIPGTQFSISIPLMPFKKERPSGLGQLNLINKVEEDYTSFVDSMEYQYNSIDCISECDSAIAQFMSLKDVTDSKDKFYMVQKWKETWKSIWLHVQSSKEDLKDIYYVDMGILEKNTYFNRGDNVEVFIKGFLESIFMLSDLQIKAFAFVGAKRLFVETFRDACMVFFLRKFPKNVQLYVNERDCVDNLILFGHNYYEVIKNGYIMSIEHGSKIISAKEFITAKELYEKTEKEIEVREEESFKLVPFDVILPRCSENQDEKIFSRRLQVLANKDIDSDDSGFLIRNTHMRLGSKVHIHSFYEMPFLFYRTAIANRIAYQILKDIYTRKIADLDNDKIMFYGYASYSKAILTSITEMLREYREKKGLNYNDVSFASYQHNLQSESEDVQMHYGFLRDFPARLVGDRVQADELIKVIQIVPISSTLTTFEKMWNRFRKSVQEKSESNFQLVGNYTIFWITDELEANPNKPSNNEKAYWSEIKEDKQLVETKFKAFKEQNNNLIRFFIRCPVKWENPLDCKWCYPKQLIDEIPLVETDQTSTVPTQQIRKKKGVASNGNLDKKTLHRIKMLRDCVSYGHIVREQNHFQYYIDTQAYFYKVKDDVKAWLKGCREKDNKANDIPMMYVIFSPEHNTNVGFAQYVNTYYFGGMAEIVSINEDKEFRSNFECEHAALIATIADLYNYIEVHNLNDMPIKFYYVDDTIISGETFQKANSFMRSLLPEKYRNSYGTNIISKCFLLVDRLSLETKRNYVRDINNDFHSFVHIDISNVRTHGDSCIGCKLKQDATNLFKRSSTRNTEKYWVEKIQRYTPIPYDNRNRMKKHQNDDAYQNLIISHITQNTIFLDNDSFEIGKVYDSTLLLAFSFLDKKKKIQGCVFKSDYLMTEVKGVEGLAKFLKILSRPFFSYDFKIKMQVLTLINILTEVFLGNLDSINAYVYDEKESHILKKFIMENGRKKNAIQLGKNILSELNQEQKLDFLQNVLLKCLTDMKSTYLLRKQTISCVYEFMEKYDLEHQDDFWKNYAQNIHRIVNCSSDEMRALNLEYLLLYGEEYEKSKDKPNEYSFLYNVVTGEKSLDKRDPFYVFCHEILFQNTRILFDGIEKDLDREQSADAYYMEQWRMFRNLDDLKGMNSDGQQIPIIAETDLFEFVKDNSGNNQKNPRTSVKEHYESLLQKILIMIENKYQLKKQDVKIALLTRTQENDEEECNAKIGELDILTDINVSYPDQKFSVKDKIVKALNSEKEKSAFSLKVDGYVLVDGTEKSYFIIYFDNSEIELEENVKRTLKPIAKVFMFLEIESNTDEKIYKLRFILRDILAYRNRIMRMLETDFAGDMFTKYAHTIGEKNIIAHEKATSHSNTYDDENVLNFLLNQSAHVKYENLDSSQAAKWLIMRNYVNEQIAKLFNRSFQEKAKSEHQHLPESPLLYVDDKAQLYMKESLYNRKLEKFNDLNLIMDARFILLESVIKIKYNDIAEAQFIVDEENRGYNVEFFKCVLLDVIFSAIKYETDKYEFLLQVNHLLNIRKLFRNEGLISKNASIRQLQEEEYLVEMFVEKTEKEKFDYLVIKNPVYKIITDWEYENDVITKKMKDPLDYADGHLSLLSIKRYIEGLREDLLGKCEFLYYEVEDEKVWFKTKLPIIRKED